MAPSRSRHSHAREIYYIVCIVLLVIVGMFSIRGRGGYVEMMRVRGELEAQRARIEALRFSNQERLRAIQALRSNKEAVERLARQNGYGREGEIVQQLQDETKPKDKNQKR